MIKLICFDLDGVLIEAKEIHYLSLNQALLKVNESFQINEQDHINHFDGLSTKVKLQKLTKERDLPEFLHKEIIKNKQKITLKLIKKSIKENKEIIELFQELKSFGYKIAVVSNSVRSTIKLSLSLLKIEQLVDFTISNQDIRLNKPYSEPYLTAMIKAEVLPRETLIFEDSPVGVKSALNSEAHVCVVSGVSDINKTFVFSNIRIANNKQRINHWVNKKLNIIIPMAGAGSRFEQVGFIDPKPLIQINGKPMIQVVVDNLCLDSNYIFLVRKEHYEKYNLKIILNYIVPDCKIILVDKLTEGAACTALLAKELINNNNPLLIANSDQFIKWDTFNVMYEIQNKDYDGCILTFKDTDPKWSFAKIDEYGWISEVAEKNPISDNATVGIYYWKHGSDFVKFAEQMINKNIRVRNEFYICPVYNEAIQNGLKIKAKKIDEMWSMGTPEDLERFLKEYK